MSSRLERKAQSASFAWMQDAFPKQQRWKGLRRCSGAWVHQQAVMRVAGYARWLI